MLLEQRLVALRASVLEHSDEIRLCIAGLVDVIRIGSVKALFEGVQSKSKVSR